MNLSPSQINQANQTANPIDAKPASNLGSPAAGRAVDAGLFADILSRHWQHLAQNERQEVAASADATFAAVGRLPAQSAPAPVKPAQEPTQDSDRVDDAAQARSDQADAAEDAARANDRAHPAAAWRADAHTALDAGRLPQVPEHLLNLSLSSSPQAQMTNDGLLVMPLGERINIVTTPQPQVNAQSVADFARSMGMNELQIEQLFGAQATVVTASDDTLSTLDRLTANGSTGALPLANSSNATGLLMQTNATSSSPVSMTQQANPLSTLASLNALGHSTLSAPLAAQAADAAQGKSSPTLPTATSVDVLTIMEADFTPEVWQALQSGQQVSIMVQGFASPLAKSDYNVHLTNRRISSIINYFEEIDGGKFAPYMQTSPLRLQFIEVPMGEFQANKEVSDNYYDQRNSVYSKDASLERRIEIIELRTQALPPR